MLIDSLEEFSKINYHSCEAKYMSLSTCNRFEETCSDNYLAIF